MSGGEGSQPISEGDNVARDDMDTGGDTNSAVGGANSAGGGTNSTGGSANSTGATSAGGVGADTAGRIDASGDDEVEVVRQIRHGTGANTASAKSKRYISPIWDHFDKDPNDLKNAVCLHCGEKVSTY